MMNHWRVFHIQFALLGFGVLLFTERFQIGDIGFVEVRVTCGIIRSYGSGSRQRFSGYGPVHFFNFTKLAEVHFRPRQHAGIPPPAAAGAAFRAFDSVFRSLNVFAQNTAFTTGAFSLSRVDARLRARRRIGGVAWAIASFSANSRFCLRFGCRGSRLLSFRRRSHSAAVSFSRSGRRRCSLYFKTIIRRTGFSLYRRCWFGDFLLGARERQALPWRLCRASR